ncbi:hypothetical protein BHOIPH791_09320 [Bartonella henselae]
MPYLINEVLPAEIARSVSQTGLWITICKVFTSSAYEKSHDIEQTKALDDFFSESTHSIILAWVPCFY